VLFNTCARLLAGSISVTIAANRAMRSMTVPPVGPGGRAGVLHSQVLHEDPRLAIADESYSGPQVSDCAPMPGKAQAAKKPRPVRAEARSCQHEEQRTGRAFLGRRSPQIRIQGAARPVLIHQHSAWASTVRQSMPWKLSSPAAVVLTTDE
jgi:hypothetical protein